MPAITPQFIVSFETKLSGLVTGNWDRVNANLMWDRVMKERPASSKVEILTWLLETARIYPEGNGGNKRFDDMLAATTSLEVFNFGAGLRLSKNEIQDNQMKDQPTVGALDYAAKWAKDMGGATAYHPQSQLFALIAAGTTATGYDGVPFFSASHPMLATGGGGTYSNIITGVPLLVTGQPTQADNILVGRKNLGTALATVRGQKFFGGVPRFLRPSILVVPTTMADVAYQVTGADIINQTTNVIQRTNQGNALEPIVAPELDADPNTYYIGVEDTLSDEMGAFIYANRENFAMTQYGPTDDAVLQRIKQFEWSMDGRNGTMYGHPYLFYKCGP